MKFRIPGLWLPICGALAAAVVSALAVETNQLPYSIDLPTVLRLAGAQNLDVALARERLAEARAQHESTRLQFFPWLSPGITYRRHDNLIQDTLRLDPVVRLEANASDLAPVSLLETNRALPELVQQALASHPTITQSRAFTEAARDAKNGTVYGPLIPSVGAQAFFGGLGGGKNGDTGNFGDQQNYFFGLSWRIGPGGLFDTGRKHAAQARLKSAQLTETKTRDELARVVVEAYAALQSAQDRLATARRALAAAEEGLHLAQERNGQSTRWRSKRIRIAR